MTSHSLLEEPSASVRQGPTWSSLVAGLLVCWVAQYAGILLTLWGTALAAERLVGWTSGRKVGDLGVGGPAIILLTAAGVAAGLGALAVRLVRGVARRHPPALVAGWILSTLMAAMMAWQLVEICRSMDWEKPETLGRCVLPAALLAGAIATIVALAMAWMGRRPLKGVGLLSALAQDAAVIGAGLWAVTVVMVAFVPKYREMFKDFRTSLPVVTKWVLEASEAMQNSVVAFGLIPVMAFILAVPLVAWRSSPPERGHLRNTAILVALGVLLAYAVIGTGLYLPMVTLIQSIRGGEGGGE